MSTRIAHLKKRAQTLTATLTLGKAGLTDNIVTELRDQLKMHEMVKVKMLHSTEDKGDKKIIAEELATKTKSELVEVKGRTAVFYKPRRPEQSKTPGQPKKAARSTKPKKSLKSTKPKKAARAARKDRAKK